MTDTPTGIRIVVADQSQARIYSAGARRLKLLGSLSDPRARLHDRDLGSDRPGRVFDRAVAPGKRRGRSPVTVRAASGHPASMRP